MRLFYLSQIDNFSNSIVSILITDVIIQINPTCHYNLPQDYNGYKKRKHSCIYQIFSSKNLRQKKKSWEVNDEKVFVTINVENIR